MKKLLTSIFALCLSMTLAYAADEQKIPQQNHKRPQLTEAQIKNIRAQKDAEFVKKLGLTEEQKVQYNEVRKKNFERIKPVMDEIMAKKKEAVEIKRNRGAVTEQEEKLTKIDEDLKVLKKKAHEIQKQNMNDFQAILTKDQKKILDNMKKEGRKNFKAKHKKCHKPMPLKAGQNK